MGDQPWDRILSGKKLYCHDCGDELRPYGCGTTYHLKHKHRHGLDISLCEACMTERVVIEQENKYAEITDETYEKLGLQKPPEGFVCSGRCEGTGIVPVRRQEQRDPFYTLWWKAAGTPMTWEEMNKCDVWQFVLCPTCQPKGIL